MDAKKIPSNTLNAPTNKPKIRISSKSPYPIGCFWFDYYLARNSLRLL